MYSRVEELNSRRIPLAKMQAVIIGLRCLFVPHESHIRRQAMCLQSDLTLHIIWHSHCRVWRDKNDFLHIMNNTSKLEASNLQQLLTALQRSGYTTVGPILRDDAIVYDKLDSVNDLPVGWSDEQSPANYRLTKQSGASYFNFNAAPQSWKRFLYPPVRKLFTIRKDGKSLGISNENTDDMKYAFVGVRPCELSAILIQDEVFQAGKYRDDAYSAARRNLFIVAVNCTTAGGTCFCSSMKTGPEAKNNFDISLTEVLRDGRHFFIVKAGTELGASVMDLVETSAASPQEVATADAIMRQTESRITKKMETDGLPALLAENLEHPHWDDVAKRCLTCGNCTMVCPTCFCSTVEDTTDLSGQNAERFRRWDSCFTVDFSKVAGGNFRMSTKSRYRQWLTHKLSSWVDQFGVSGCVGCGRCITWCPVGIDLTAEVQAIRGTETQQRKGD